MQKTDVPPPPHPSFHFINGNSPPPVLRLDFQSYKMLFSFQTSGKDLGIFFGQNCKTTLSIQLDTGEYLNMNS